MKLASSCKKKLQCHACLKSQATLWVSPVPKLINDPFLLQAVASYHWDIQIVICHVQVIGNFLKYFKLKTFTKNIILPPAKIICYIFVIIGKQYLHSSTFILIPLSSCLNNNAFLNLTTWQCDCDIRFHWENQHKSNQNLCVLSIPACFKRSNKYFFLTIWFHLSTTFTTFINFKVFSLIIRIYCKFSSYKMYYVLSYSWLNSFIYHDKNHN